MNFPHLKGGSSIGRGWKLGLASFGLVCALYVAHPYYLLALGHFLIVSDPLTKADAIIVLAGGGPRHERLLHAINLWEASYAPRIVLSAKLAEWQTHEDYPAWRYAKKLDVLPDDALLVAAHFASSTKEEAQRLFPFVLRRNYKSVIIVTSNYHTRRAKSVYEQQWPCSSIDFRISAAPTTGFRPEDWWTRRTDSEMFLYEFTKTIWYAIME